MTKVAGIDSSTQSTKIVVCDADTGKVIGSAQAPHPEGTSVPPSEWWSALSVAGAGLLDDVAAIGVGAQQHGLVALDEAGEVVRPALLWNDTRSASAAEDLVRELGGPSAWAEAVGSVPVASFTVTKLRWLASHEPDVAARVTDVMLPHDWLTWRLLGGSVAPVTDRGDASGTGYWSPATGSYREDIISRAFGRVPRLPRVLGPGEPAGETSAGVLVSAGTGDNMAAALGLDARPGDVVVSLGTSGTVFAVHGSPVADSSGTVAGFADATGRYLPLVCTLNAARVLTAAAQMLDTDLAGLDRLALEAPAGADGLVLLPYLEGERTPNLPDASGSLVGLRRTNMTPSHVARAAVEGMLCGLADGLDALRAFGVEVRRVLLIGGASRSRAVRAVAPVVFGAPVVVPEPGEYVALGAARQAAWALGGGAEPPNWGGDQSSVELVEGADGDAGKRIRSAYAEARVAMYGH
ncbi:xylulokinase [Planosporangium flavigriseum]|uniref:Xylulose kinase n=1 Tax=Planosporangium flavigriseum TaxID=373681 RepID=A0A8J3LRB7_9ACTN|nr:xylulokinase [Planosporangium flavigriseum]NJC65139.1 xylulokinase [Planosporangium flavigriseum]GIG71755.1 xylulokinase [Planosporangium flavigriseum]